MFFSDFVLKSFLSLTLKSLLLLEGFIVDSGLKFATDLLSLILLLILLGFSERPTAFPTGIFLAFNLDWFISSKVLLISSTIN